MSREEKYWRYQLRWVTGTPKTGIFGHEYIEKNPICSKFLNSHPRPTIEELHQAIYPFGEPSYHLDLNKSDDYFEKQKELEKKKREEIMLEIINAKEKKNLKNLVKIICLPLYEPIHLLVGSSTTVFLSLLRKSRISCFVIFLNDIWS